MKLPVLPIDNVAYPKCGGRVQELKFLALSIHMILRLRLMSRDFSIIVREYSRRA